MCLERVMSLGTLKKQNKTTGISIGKYGIRISDFPIKHEIQKRILRDSLLHVLLGNSKSGFHNPNTDYPIESTQRRRQQQQQQSNKTEVQINLQYLEKFLIQVIHAQFKML